MPESSQNVNATATENWNISTLKAYLETKIVAVVTETTLKFQARDQAQKLQYEIDQEHFKALNHEAARILKATEITVSRDTWDAFREGDVAWKAKTDAMLQTLLPKAEFIIYKDGTEKALNLGAGKWQGVLQLITTVASIAAIIGVVLLFMRPA